MGKEGIFHKDTPLLRWGMPLLAIIVTLLVMWPTLGNDFVNWDDPVEAVTPGQAIVAYGTEGSPEEDTVLGGGWIKTVG